MTHLSVVREFHQHFGVGDVWHPRGEQIHFAKQGKDVHQWNVNDAFGHCTDHLGSFLVFIKYLLVTLFYMAGPAFFVVNGVEKELETILVCNQLLDQFAFHEDFYFFIIPFENLFILADDEFLFEFLLEKI